MILSSLGSGGGEWRPQWPAGSRLAEPGSAPAHACESRHRGGSIAVRVPGYHRVLMVEAHFAEIEKTLLYISEARQRAERATAALRRDDAESHLIAALEEAERELEALGRKLMQQTYFAVPKEQLSLEPDALTLS